MGRAIEAVDSAVMIRLRSQYKAFVLFNAHTSVIHHGMLPIQTAHWATFVKLMLVRMWIACPKDWSLAQPAVASERPSKSLTKV